MVEAGILSTYIDKVFPMEDIVKAHEYVESGQKRAIWLLKSMTNYSEFPRTQNNS